MPQATERGRQRLAGRVRQRSSVEFCMSQGVRQRHGKRCNGRSCGCPWEASVYSRRDGRKIRKVFPTKAAAIAWREETRVAVRRFLVGAPATVTLEDAAEAWFQGAREGWIRTRSGDRYKAAAIRAYEVGFRMRAQPVLGARRLSQVSRNDIQDLVDELLASGCRPSTVVVTVSAVRVVYKRAMARGEVVINPVSGVQLPAVRTTPVRIATPEECARLLSVLRQRDRAIWATAMYAGLRRGELMALRISDVDLERGVINVLRGWDTLDGEITPKSGRRRVVPIASILRDELEARIETSPWRDGLIFGVGPTRPFHGTPLFRRAERAWDAAGLQRITLHECRHTFASLMIAAGVNAKALSTYMGHATISITMDRYGHLMPGNETQAASMLDRYLALAPPTRQSPRNSGQRARRKGSVRAGSALSRAVAGTSAGT